MSESLLDLMADIDVAEEASPRGLDLFLQLNEEYRLKPVIASPRKPDDASRLALARRRARQLDQRAGLRGRRVLEVGCGAGDLAAVLAGEYDCEVVGVDVKTYPTWHDLDVPGLTLKVMDVTQEDCSALGRFERIVSLVVWEHVRHPHAGLRACRDLLDVDGLFYLRANLHRSAVASHLYRDVYFPWPHLLFSDEIFEAFYASLGRRPQRPSWVNRLTWAQYLLYFGELGLVVEREWLKHRPIDEAFYARFADVLSRYPRFDLGLDFFDVILSRRRPGRSASAAGEDAAGPGRRVPTSRAWQLALRLWMRPRSLAWWLTLPVDVVRILLRRGPGNRLCNPVERP